MNEQDIAGGALDFLAGLVGRCCTMACGDHGGISYEVLGEAASRVRPGSNGVIVTPWLNGERTPVDDTTVPVSYTHLRAHETPEHLVCRLLLEKKQKTKNTRIEKYGTSTTQSIKH